MTSNWLVIRSQQIPLSFRLDRRVPRLVLILGCILLIVLSLSISYGEYPVPLVDVAKILVGLESSDPDFTFVVKILRLPRSLTALLVGIALALAGTITQGLLRNPLASPGIIGIDSGAALAAVALIIAFPTITASILPLVAFVGGMTAFILIYLLAWKSGSSPIRLVLVGIGFSLMTAAVTNILITFGNIYDVSQALVWLTGSVYGRSWPEVIGLLPWLGVFVPMALVMARDLNILNLGDDVARGVGSPLEWRRGLLLIISVSLSGAAVATAGTVGFVGFIAPHIARRLVGPTHEGLLLTAGMVGGVLVVTSDLIGRVLFAPIELPCGLVTSLIGAPYFLYLLTQTSRSR